MKAYDRAYFDRWYRHPRHAVQNDVTLERKVHLAVSITEFLLGRRVRSVLDVGCGEARWFPVLRRMRPGVRYIGIEASDYAIERYGESRNIRRGTFGELPDMRLPKSIDLVVCADVLQYVETRDVERGLRAIRRLLGGVAYLETYTTSDDMVGDREGWLERSEEDYRRLFRAAKLVQCGPYSWVASTTDLALNDFEWCRSL